VRTGPENPGTVLVITKRGGKKHRKFWSLTPVAELFLWGIGFEKIFKMQGSFQNKS